MAHFQLVVIGAGTGGYTAAIKAAQLGMTVALIERDEVGGTCLNRGCIPTKTLLHSADLFSEITHAESLGVHIKDASVDYAALRGRVDHVVATLRDGIESLLEGNGITLIRGYAFVDSSQHVVITQSNGSETSLTCNNIIIATGSQPSMPPIPGIELSGVYNSDTFLAAVPEVRRLAIIGGGVIGMEFAGLYTSLGVEVTVLEGAARILPSFDRELSQSLSMVMKKRGCHIVTGAMVQVIERANGARELRVAYDSKGSQSFVETDAVLVCTGRAATVDQVFSKECCPSLDRGRIIVDEAMKTSIENIYAIGDATVGELQLAHAAAAQGITAACSCANVASEIDLENIPACVYTSPEIACVGLSETQAKERDMKVRVGKYSLAGNGKSVITNQDRSFIKIVVDGQDRMVGAQLMCGRATDIVGELTVAIAQGLTIGQMASVVRPHPTFDEAVGEAVESLLGGAIHAMPKKRKIQKC